MGFATRENMPVFRVSLRQAQHLLHQGSDLCPDETSFPQFVTSSRCSGYPGTAKIGECDRLRRWSGSVIVRPDDTCSRNFQRRHRKARGSP